MDWQLEEFYRDLRLKRDVGENTLETYSVAFRQLQAACPELTVAAVLDWYEALKRAGQHKPSTIKTRLVIVKNYLHWAQRRGLTEAGEILAEVNEIVPPKYHTARYALSYADMAALLAQPDLSRKRGRRDLVILHLMYLALRIGEVLAIKEDDIDWRNATLLVHGKGQRERLVALLQQETDQKTRQPIGQKRVYELLEDYLTEAKISPDGRIFPIDQNIVRKHIADYAAGARLRHITPHWLRHTALTHMSEAGASLPHVAGTAGHASVATTTIYLHLDNAGVSTIRKYHPIAQGLVAPSSDPPRLRLLQPA